MLLPFVVLLQPIITTTYAFVAVPPYLPSLSSSSRRGRKKAPPPWPPYEDDVVSSRRRKRDVDVVRRRAHPSEKEEDGPNLEQTLAAASYIKNQLQEHSPSKTSFTATLSSSTSSSLHDEDDADTSMSTIVPYLLHDLFGIASSLMEDHQEYEEASKLFHFSLNYYNDGNGNLNHEDDDNDMELAIRERLAACYRNLHQYKDCANELYTIIQRSSSNNKNSLSSEMLSWLYLDLGHVLEEIQPLPGSGVQWDYEVKGVQLNDLDNSHNDESTTASLTPLDCYNESIQLDPSNGIAYKRLADALAITASTLQEDNNNKQILTAEDAFRKAHQLLPNDIACATHVYYYDNNNNQRAQQQEQQRKTALPMASAAADKEGGTTLQELCWNSSNDLNDKESLVKMAQSFERDGVLVLPGFLLDHEEEEGEENETDDSSSIQILMNTISKVLEEVNPPSEQHTDMEEEQEENDNNDSTMDFTTETRAPTNRIHMAFPLEDNDTRKVVSKLFQRMYPLLSIILQCQDDDDDDDGVEIPLLGSGFMKTSPGAKGQILHKDVHHYDRHLPVKEMPLQASPNLGEPRCISIQLQLTDATTTTTTTTTSSDSSSSTMGSLEVFPGSHRPDAYNGHPNIIQQAIDNNNENVIPINVPIGSVTIYSSRLWHCGGSNTSDRQRTFCFWTVCEPNTKLAPPGLIHTLPNPNYIGRFHVTPQHGLLDTHMPSAKGKKTKKPTNNET